MRLGRSSHQSRLSQAMRRVALVLALMLLGRWVRLEELTAIRYRFVHLFCTPIADYLFHV